MTKQKIPHDGFQVEVEKDEGVSGTWEAYLHLFPHKVQGAFPDNQYGSAILRNEENKGVAPGLNMRDYIGKVISIIHRLFVSAMSSSLKQPISLGLRCKNPHYMSSWNLSRSR